MAFDLDGYVKKHQAENFDLDNYVAKNAPKEKGGALRAASDAFANTATLGYLPQIEAGIQKALPDPGAKVDADLRAKGFTIDQPDQSYIANRDAAIARLKQQGKDFPVANAVGTVGGIGASVLAGGLARGAAKGASLLQRLISSGKTGAVMGAAVNPGDTEGERNPVQLGDRAVNAGTGAVIGTALQGGVEALGPVARRAAEYLKTKAAKKATRAVGRPTPTEAAAMAKSGEDVTIGRTLLNEKAIPVLGTPGRIKNRVDALRETSWESVDELLSSGGESSVVDGAAVGVKLLESPTLALLRKTPGAESTVKAIEAAAETFAQNGSMTLKEAQAIKRSIDKQIRYQKGIPDLDGKQQAMFEGRTVLRDQMDEAVGDLGAGKGALKAAFKKQGVLEKASDLAEKEAGRTQANRAISLTDTIAGAAGASTGNPLAAIGLTALNKAGRSVGNAVQARGFDAAGNLIAKVPAMAAFAKANPVAFQVLANQLTPNYENKPAAENPILNDKLIMDQFEKNPALLNAVEDPKLREQIRNRFNANKDTAIKRRISSQ